MKIRFEGDPLEALRDADPLDPRDVPQNTTGARARALFQEVVSMDTQQKESKLRNGPAVTPRLAIAGVAAVALVIAGIGVFGDTPEAILGGEPIASAALCVETYDLSTLANREVAFDGTVASIDGSQVRFAVNHWYRGGVGDEVSLNAQGLTEITSLDGPGIEVGQRYLVSGSGGFVWACGFTMTYDSGVAQDWAGVFGS
jgi:hypothetical protein